MCWCRSRTASTLRMWRRSMRLRRAVERRLSTPISCATRRRTREAGLLIADGRIGRPYHARVHYHYLERGVDYEPPPGREWLYRWGLKGGALGQHGSHYLDQAWYLLGCPEPQWAFAISHSAFPTRLEVERHSEDYMSFLVGCCAGGVTSSDGHVCGHRHVGGPGVGPASAGPGHGWDG